MSEIQVPVTEQKELKDVLSGLKAVVADVVAGKDVATIASDSLPVLLNAFANYKVLPAEVMSQSGLDTVALSVSSVVGALLKVTA